jgi:DNA-binding MarR family transcriptional regulator
MLLERLSFLKGNVKETRKINETAGEKGRVFRVIAEQDVFDFKFLAEQTGLSKGFLSKVLAQLCDKNLVVRGGKDSGC